MPCLFREVVGKEEEVGNVHLARTIQVVQRIRPAEVVAKEQEFLEVHFSTAVKVTG